MCFVRSNLGSLAGYLQDLFDLLDAYGALEKSCPADALPSTIRDLKIRTDYAFIRQDCGQLISESQEGIGRVAQLVSDLKSFSRADDKQWRSVILHTGLDSTLNIIGNEIKYHCTLKKAYGNIPEVYCLPSQINQVFLNLLVNAAQAIPGKGEITITTGQAGSEVFVTIADTGAGIANEDLPRLFDPFFTTKPVGQGTGLGLSIAYGIVQKHLGRIDVKSTVGKGTAFTVWLPIKPSPATSSAE